MFVSVITRTGSCCRDAVQQLYRPCCVPSEAPLKADVHKINLATFKRIRIRIIMFNEEDQKGHHVQRRASHTITTDTRHLESHSSGIRTRLAEVAGHRPPLVPVMNPNILQHRQHHANTPSTVPDVWTTQSPPLKASPSGLETSRVTLGRCLGEQRDINTAEISF